MMSNAAAVYGVPAPWQAPWDCTKISADRSSLSLPCVVGMRPGDSYGTWRFAALSTPLARALDLPGQGLAWPWPGRSSARWIRVTGPNKRKATAWSPCASISPRQDRHLAPSEEPDTKPACHHAAEDGLDRVVCRQRDVPLLASGCRDAESPRLCLQVVHQPESVNDRRQRKQSRNTQPRPGR